jgi:GT2 family glycosyltransferase
MAQRSLIISTTLYPLMHPGSIISPTLPATTTENINPAVKASAQATSPRVNVILLNWNAAADTLACLQHVAAWKQIQPHVWVVDNASQADDLAQLQAGLAIVSIPCTLIRNAQNLGFAGGTNCGLRAALATDSAPLLLLNNDALLAESDIARMVATLDERPDAAVVGPALYTPGPPAKLLSAGYRDPAYHHHTLITTPPADMPVFAVDYTSGSAALIRAALLHEIGLLDEDYFFNTEVADLCQRARMAGYLTLVDLRARAYHNLERSSALRSTLYTYYLVRNRLLYIRKIYPARTWWLGTFWATYTLLLSVKVRLQGERATAHAIYLALGDALTGRWGGQNQRVLAACQRFLATP